MNNGDILKLWSNITQATIERMPSISRLFEGRPLYRSRMPAVEVEDYFLVRLDLNAKNTCVGDYHYEVDLCTQSTIPRSKVERMQSHPFVWPRGKHVEHISLTRRRTIVREGGD